ncbi:trafficking protein particle complex subunit 6A, putative [Plasmodium vinckei vinckei]|uniref:Trafficking protein particle complex subunit 6A, putative n=1 Tax=Plasmodium vinckei vinckei TaxID=54757 RepID=A0A449BV10_PLAVN|nr:trafficking protein particle complex subunit 6A, putative [Plasmodium vinckei vinckei]VEV57305.1 trafficking protein particle complex subunit 6A, putative [Plasmodium vinckei vinckei]
MQPRQMSEGKISKITLLLLINEIINFNIKLVKDNILDSVSDGENVKQTSDEKYEEVKNKLDKQDNKLDSSIPSQIEKSNDDGDQSKQNCTDIDEGKHHTNILTNRLRDMGKGIGIKLIERILIYKNDIADIKDIIKIIGKDMWLIIFNKTIDKLQTYKKNIYIIVDNDISIYLKHSMIDNGTNQKNNFIHAFIILIIGIIKGVLSRFKIDACIAYNLNYPACSFQINIHDE